ncbi:hypothetical protein [Methanobacterium ferruginis]|jgi:hypothetical protein|uniref:hypothetical protein n=1 Tax=Methanobacterium ferruginis TaxID=710191 RepID=UPI0025722B71|nr:hypothetical protein [Methanobacterium ferruginis]BDZ68258.1 hypothetical protein GCM10025860_17060 [Methanobacterium ferruginis]
MDKDEFVEKINQENVIHVEFDEDEVDIVYDVTDPDTGEYDPLVVIDTANMANEHKINGKLISLNFFEDENLRCARICLKSDIMNDDLLL